VLALIVTSVIFLTLTVIFSLALYLCDRRLPSRCCSRTVHGAGRPGPAAFERCRDNCTDDGQMLVMVDRDDGTADDAGKIASDDDSV